MSYFKGFYLSILNMRILKEGGQLMNKIKLNSERFVMHLKNMAGILFAIASGVLLFIDKNDFKLDSALKGVAVIAAILFFQFCMLQ